MRSRWPEPVLSEQLYNDASAGGTVGRQTTFSFASPAEIRQKVKERVETLGRAGLILCPAYDIDEPDIPQANIAAFLAAARAYG